MNLRTDARAAVRDFAVYGLGSVLGQAIAVALVPLYTRALGVSDYGVLALLTGLQAVLVVLSQCGLASALFRSYYDYTEPAAQRRVIGTTTTLILTTSALVFGIGFLLADQLVRLPILFSTSTAEVRLVAAIAALEGLNVVPLAVFRARRQASRYVVTAVVGVVIRLSAIVYLVAFRHAGVPGVLWGTMLGSSAVLLVGGVQAFWWVLPTFHRRDAGKLLRFGVPLIPGNLAGWVLMVSGRYFLAHYGGVAIVGIYALGERIASVLSVLLIQPLALLWLPIMLSVHRKTYAHRFYVRALTLYVVGGACLGLGLALFSKELLAVLATPSFLPARRYVFPLCWVTILYGAQRILNVGSDLTRKSENTSLSVIAGAVVFTGMAALLIPSWSAVGLIAALCGAYLVMDAFTFLLAWRLYPLRYQWGQIVGVFGLSSAAYGAGLAVERAFPTAPIAVAALKVFLVSGFVAALLGCRFIQAGERRETIHYLRRWFGGKPAAPLPACDDDPRGEETHVTHSLRRPKP